MPSSRKPVAARDAQTVLVLQGGGALGAYQGGVFEALAAHGHQPDWVVGTSIGAINGAIIAGNPPERRLERLRAFWDEIARDEPLAPIAASPWAAWLAPWFGPWASAGVVWDTLTRGIPGFFEPRGGAALDIRRTLPTREASFYDTTPLRRTLERLVDFEYLNAGPVRCTVCAVDIAAGEQVTFDTRKHRLGPQHIMASGALPPGFPPIVIDGRAYWDGGIYSNTPVDVVMDDAERRDTLAFMVDLWDPTEDEPRSISAALMRHKDIQYASRTREHLEDHRTMQNLRRAVDLLWRQASPAQRANPRLQRAARLGCGSTIDIVRLILKATPEDDHNKDIDFARSRIERRWQTGRRDAERALRHKAWLQPPPADAGMVIHALLQDEGGA
ncbi:MAG: patatin-like phospholipase family protein [Burkholderiaceae bacterium]